MKQLKKTLLTLVALLAVTTGAWAQEQSETIATTAKIVEGTHFTISNNGNYADGDGMCAMNDGITVTPKNGETITKVVISCTFSENNVNDGNTSVSSGTKEITNGGGTITVTGVNASTFTFTCSDAPQFGQFVVYYTETSSGPTVTWTAASKTGSFTMPGGNVTLEPDYYPQATAAEGAVTAATDVKATTDAPLVTIDETKLTGVKKMMYYVSTDATAPAYDAQGWTDVLPTAENYTEAATLNVWYYPVGTDEGDDETTATYSDGDICATALTVTLGAAPTYAVTLNDEGLSTDEAAAWKVAKGTDQPAAFPLEGVTKGQPVTVTYNGSKKVIGVKAEKKAAAAGPITVTWYNDDITGSGKSFTKDGVTITASEIDFDDKNFQDGTFTTTLGNFTKIEVTTANWQASGTGWFYSTWTGNASSVSFSGSITGGGSGNTKFVFTIEPTN